MTVKVSNGNVDGEVRKEKAEVEKGTDAGGTGASCYHSCVCNAPHQPFLCVQWGHITLSFEHTLVHLARRG